jgi:hypothetical protein
VARIAAEDAIELVFVLVISFLQVWFCFERTTLMRAIAVGKACALFGVGALCVQPLARAE